MFMTVLTGAASVAVLLGTGFVCGRLCVRHGAVHRGELFSRKGGQALLSAADLREWRRFLSYDGRSPEEDEGL